MIRDGIKSVNRQGACSETLWPYDVSQFTKKPPTICYQSALHHRALSYRRVAHTNLAQLKGCLASGYGFVFGITVYESFESDQVASTGVVPMPAHREQVLGGHALFACGYDDEHQWFIVQNSWSTSFGDKGFIYIPYAYLTSSSLASDFWVIRTVQ
jgi:C1A family cysteine protease